MRRDGSTMAFPRQQQLVPRRRATEADRFTLAVDVVVGRMPAGVLRRPALFRRRLRHGNANLLPTSSSGLRRHERTLSAGPPVRCRSTMSTRCA